MKVRALWALSQLARYDEKVIQVIREFANSEMDISIKRIAKSILDQLDLQEKISEEKSVVPKKTTSATISQPVEKSETKFDIFLSHNSVDKKWAIKLKSALEKLNIKVWLDKDEIRPGDLFVKALEDGIKESKCIGIIISPESIASGWVQEEYSHALSIANSAPCTLRLIPILLRDATLPGFLSSRNWVDFRDELNFADNLKRLVWGITGEKPTSE
ncbi:MAG: toll/interleukin-1 receptor domain-containing protein [Anaerolineales bacterium]